MSLLDDLKGGVAAFHDALTALRGHLYNHPAPTGALPDSEVQAAIDKVNGMATEVSDLHQSMTQQAAAAQEEQTAEDNSADDLNAAEAEAGPAALTPPQQ